MKINFLAFLPFAFDSVDAIGGKPNFIVMQPDDLHFLEAWSPPAHFDDSGIIEIPALSLIPNIERLRGEGLQMLQAHTASPMCGTSRYSTITGRYPSRSSHGRLRDHNEAIRDVTIPKTKLMDISSVVDGNDCSENNLAALFQANEYRTGVVGKWHLYDYGDDDFSYTTVQTGIRGCGFDYAEAIYPENFSGSWTTQYDGVNHNMEHVASKAIEFIHDSIAVQEQSFFLYLNPTVPHSSGDVTDALTSGDCRNTVEGFLDVQPSIHFGAPSNYDDDASCRTYRQSVLDRASGSLRGREADKELGMIWIDDAIGWILDTLTELAELENTFFLFQMDHGQEGKRSLYEAGTRIAQFIHYPAAFGPETTFDGLVSTIDIGPTMLELAGINDTSDGWYHMDGKSWANALESSNTIYEWQDRCIFFELGEDRGVKCGCDKYMRLPVSSQDSRVLAARQSLILDDNGADQMFDICQAQEGQIPEQNGMTLLADTNTLDVMSDLVDCHLTNTDPSMDPDYDFDCTNEGTTDVPTSVTCENGGDFDVTSRNGWTRTRSCDWIGTGRKRDNRCAEYGQHCPVACDLCLNM